MGLCCQKVQEDTTLDPLELPQSREIECSDSTSSISAGIHSEELWGNRREEEVDDQVYDIYHTLVG